MSEMMDSNKSSSSEIFSSEALNFLEKIKSGLPNSKYTLYEMKKIDEDYKTIVQAYTGSIIVGKFYLRPSKLYRVVENCEAKKYENNSNNLMLFHGTGCDGVTGILRKGYLPSLTGSYGPGVYLTNCSKLAQSYSLLKRKLKDINASFVFVSEVLSSKNLNVVRKIKPSVEKRINKGCKKNTFEMYIDQNSKKLQKLDFVLDSESRKVPKSSYKHEHGSDYSIFRAHEKMVIPRYLIYSAF